MIQWSNLTKCGLFFNIVSAAVHTLFPLVLQRLDSRGIEAFILILKIVLNCRHDFIIGPIIFFMLGNRKLGDGAKLGEYGGWSTRSKPLSHTAAIVTTDLCARALSWWNRTPFVSFPGRLRNVSSQYYFSKSLITYPVWVYLEGNNAVSIKKDWM